MACPRGCGTILWAVDVENHLTWCMRQFACCAAVTESYEQYIEKLFSRSEWLKRCYALAIRMQADPTYTAEEFDEQSAMPALPELAVDHAVNAEKAKQAAADEAEEAAAVLSGADASAEAVAQRQRDRERRRRSTVMSMRVSTPSHAPSRQHAAEMARVAQLMRERPASPTHRDALAKLKAHIDETKRREEEEAQGRDPDAKETAEVMAFLQQRADDLSKERAWRAKNVTGTLDSRDPDCFKVCQCVVAACCRAVQQVDSLHLPPLRQELHEWILVPDVPISEAVKDREERPSTSRLAPVDASAHLKAAASRVDHVIRVGEKFEGKKTVTKRADGSVVDVAEGQGATSGYHKTLPHTRRRAGAVSARSSERRSTVFSASSAGFSAVSSLSDPQSGAGGGAGYGAGAGDDRRFSQSSGVQRLRREGGLLRMCEKHGSNPLIRAATMGQMTRLRVLLPMLAVPAVEAEVRPPRTVVPQQAPDTVCECVFQQARNGDTALTVACRNGHMPVVELLLNKGCDINKETSRGLCVPPTDPRLLSELSRRSHFNRPPSLLSTQYPSD